MSWLYISGRGHSGTTIMDIILGNSEEIESFGEIISGMNRIDDTCGCNQTMKECSFWKSVILNYESDNSSWIKDVAFLKGKTHSKYWLYLYLTGHYFKGESALKKINIKVYTSIKTNISSQNNKWILDSSKEPTRALFLLLNNDDAKVIYLVKNPYDVANSYKKRFIKYGYFNFLRRLYKNKRDFIFLSFVIGISWTIGNLMNELIKLRFPKRVLVVRYEDFINDFDGTVSEIGEFLNSDLNDIKEMKLKDQPFSIGHNIGGNKIRTKGSVKLEHVESKKLLTKLESFLVNISTFILRWKYKY